MARAPYTLTVHLRVCRCASYPQELAKARILRRLTTTADGYWSVYFTFWGHLSPLIELLIVDIRDGQVMWRNGRLTKGGERATQSEDASRTAKRA